MIEADFSMVFILWAKTVMMLPLFSGRLATRSLPALYHFGGWSAGTKTTPRSFPPPGMLRNRFVRSIRQRIVILSEREGSRPCCHSEGEARSRSRSIQSEAEGTSPEGRISGLSNPEQKSEILRYAQDDRNAALLRMTGKGRSFPYGMLRNRFGRSIRQRIVILSGREGSRV